MQRNQTMPEAFFTPFFPRTGDCSAIDFTVVDRQPRRDGWEVVTFRRADGSTFTGFVKLFAEDPATNEQEQREGNSGGDAV